MDYGDGITGSEAVNVGCPDCKGTGWQSQPPGDVAAHEATLEALGRSHGKEVAYLERMVEGRSAAARASKHSRQADMLMNEADDYERRAVEARLIRDAVAAGLVAIREVATLRAEHARLTAACREAVTFIENGVELGFIRMPDADCPDSAHNTLPMLKAALAASPSTGPATEEPR